jgi:hypothetical protein
VSNSPALPSKSRSRADAGVRAPPRSDRFHLRGKKIRSTSRLAGCSPPPSLALRARRRARNLRGPIDRVEHRHESDGARDPPDLGAVTDAFQSLRPGLHAGFPLLGLSKERPSIVRTPGSPSPGWSGPERARSVSSALRDGNAASHPRSVLVVSHHLDGFLLHDAATILQAAADPGVHHVSFRRGTEFPAVPFLPFEAFPPPTASGPRRKSSVPAVRVTGSTVSDRSVHRVPCPLALSLPACTALARR